MSFKPPGQVNTGSFGLASGSASQQGDGVSWAMKHPCSVVCLVAGWLPEELVESGVKRLLMLARDCPSARLLILDVSLRKEWCREGADTPYPVEFLQKFTKDRRENVRVTIMDATKEPAEAVPGISVENLPTTVVFQGGKVATGGAVQGFMRKDMQAIETLVRQSSSQGATRSSASSSFAPSDKPKELARADSAAPLSLPQGIEMCATTAAWLFTDAVGRVKSLEGALASAKAGGTGKGTVMGKELEAVEQDISRAAADAEDMRFGGQGPGVSKGSRAKRLHESGLATTQVCAAAEGLLDVCNAQSSMQEHLYNDIRKSLALLDPQADWIREDISLLRGITHTDARSVSPPKVSPLAKNLRTMHAPTQPPSHKEPVSPAWYVPFGSASRGTPGAVMWGGHVDNSVSPPPEKVNSRRTAFSVTHTPPHTPESTMNVTPSDKEGRRGASSVQEVLKMVGSLRVGSSPLGPANRKT